MDNYTEIPLPPASTPIYRTPEATTPSEGKVGSLSTARQRKSQRLSGRAGLSPTDLSDTFTELDGSYEHMGNKIVNDYTPEELNYIIERVNREYGVVQTPEGLKVYNDDGVLQPYEGSTGDLASLYTFGTRDGGIKVGTWGGLDPRERYSEETLRSYAERSGQPYRPSTAAREQAPAARALTLAQRMNKDKVVASGTGGKGQQYRDPQDFITTLLPYAGVVGNTLGVDPSAIVAQAALETGWGSKVITDEDGNDSFNIFNIKATGDWNGDTVEVLTHEYVDGEKVARREKFRSYSSLAEAVGDYSRLMLTQERYQGLLGQNLDSEAFGSGLQAAGYATDPNYGKLIKDVAESPTLSNVLNSLEGEGYAIPGRDQGLRDLPAGMQEEYGVDPEQLLDNKILPYDKVRLLEGLIHGNRAWREQRTLQSPAGGDVGEYLAQKDLHGSGTTEIYRQAPELDPEAVINREALWGRFNELYRPEHQGRLSREESMARNREYIDRVAPHLRNKSAAARTYNFLAGGLSTFYNHLVLGTADTALELLGGDLGTAEEKAAMANRLFGYDDRYMNEAMESISKNVENIYNAIQSGEDIDLSDLWEILKTGLLTPELLTTSLGFVAATAFGFGKFTKVGQAIRGTEKAFRAGKISKAAAKAEVKDFRKAHTLLENTAQVLANNAGYISVVSGMTNDTIDAFQENNQGISDAGDAIRIFAIQSVAVGLDRFSAGMAGRNLPLLRMMFTGQSAKATKNIVKEMDVKEYSKFYQKATAALKGARSLSASAVGEGVTEYIQTLMELTSEQWYTEQYGKDLAAILSTDDAQIDAFTGAAVGFVTGAEMDAAGKVAKGLTQIGRGKESESSDRPQESSKDLLSPTPETRAEDRRTFSTAFADLDSVLDKKEPEPDDLSDILDALTTLDETRYTMEDSDVAQIEALDALVSKAEERLAALVIDSEDSAVVLRASKRAQSIAAKAAEQAKAEAAEEAPEATPEKKEARKKAIETAISTASTLLSDATTVEEELELSAKVMAAYTAARNEGIELSDDSYNTADAATGTINRYREQGFELIPIASTPYDKSTMEVAKVIHDDTIAKGEEVVTSVKRPLIMQNGKVFQKPLVIVSVGTGKNLGTPADTSTEGDITTPAEPADTKVTPEASARLVERMVVAALRTSDGELSEDQKRRLYSFASSNGVSKETVEKLIMSRASVELEATIEYRGALERRDRLRNALLSEDVKSKDIEQQYSEASSFLSATVTSIAQLEAGIRKARELATSFNNRKVPRQNKDDQKVITEYLTHPESKSKGKPFDILVKYDKNKKNWVAIVGEAETRISDKKRTRRTLELLIAEFHETASAYLSEDTISARNRYTVPSSTDNKGTSAKENAFLKNVIAALGGKAVTKVILGANRSAGWGPKSAKLRMNSTLVNTESKSEEGGTYSSGDVVYVHSKNPPKKGKKTPKHEIRNPNSELSKEIKAAVTAGATIVLAFDSGPVTPGAKGSGPGLSIAAALKRYHNYIPLGVSPTESKIFVPDNEANASRLAASKAALAAEKEAKKLKDKRQKRLVYLHIELEAARISSDHRPIAEIESDIIEATEAVEEYFSESAIASAKAAAKLVYEERQAALNDDTITVDGSVIVDDNKAEEVVEEGEQSEMDKLIEQELAAAMEGEAYDEDLIAFTPEASMEEKIQSFVMNRMAKALNEAKKGIHEADIDGSVVGFANKHLQVLAERALEIEAERGDVGSKVLAAWSDARKAGLEGKELLGPINDALEGTGVKAVWEQEDAGPDDIVLGGIAEEVLNEAVGRGNALATYSLQVRNVMSDGTTDIRYVTVFSRGHHKVGDPYTKEPVPRTAEQAAIQAEAREKAAKAQEARKAKKDAERKAAGKEVKPARQSTKESKGKDKPVVLSTEILAITEKWHDPGKYVKVTNKTPFNSLPVDTLPTVFRSIADGVKESFKKVVTKMDRLEVGLTHPRDGTDSSGIYLPINSPARTLLFDKNGNLHDSSALAMGVAIRGLLLTSQGVLGLGYKTKEAVAAMFRLRGSDPTSAMYEMAKKHGMYARTVADTLGKGFLREMGINSISESDVNIHHYENLVADIGNIIANIAVEQGILEATTEKSNNLAKLMPQGEEFTGDKADIDTTFYNIPQTKPAATENSTVPRTEHAPTAMKAVREAEHIDELFSGAGTGRKGVNFGNPPSRTAQRKATNKIRNDKVNALVPKVAKRVLKLFMNTEYQAGTKDIDVFLQAVDDDIEMTGFMSVLGFIPIDDNNPAYQKLLYKEKQIQAHKNNDILKSIRQIREVRDMLRDGKVENSMFFLMYYMGNHRFGFDTNTINPQADKLHRFFFTPKALEVTYEIDRAKNTFVYKYVTNGETREIESSLLVRAALAQALGFDIDKEPTEDIITAGNFFLSLTADEVVAMKEVYLATGVVTFPHGGVMKDATPDHPAHAIQALHFLEEFSSSNSKEITSSLSLETDALTSGFANKVQQLGTLTDLDTHAARVGFIRDVLSNPYRGSLDEDRGTNDLLASEGFRDSYQSLASKVITKVGALIEGLDSSNTKLFTSIRPLLPGSALIGTLSPTVDKALRTLFKPAFMTFNYSASIKSIVANLSIEVAEGIMTSIAAADFTDLDDPANRAAYDVATALAKKLVRVGGKEVTAKELQHRLRTEDLATITTTKKTLGDDSAGEGKVIPLTKFIAEDLIAPTYGEAVDVVFKDEFKEFIQIQDATNDAFQYAYTVFNQHLNNKVKAFRKQGGVTITKEIMSGMITELKGAFPLIAGPLTMMFEEGDDDSAGIHIYDTTTSKVNSILYSEPSPQTRMNIKSVKKPGTRVKGSQKINPIARQIVAAANAGAVLPFHAIDGAQLALTMTRFFDKILAGNETVKGVKRQQESDPDSAGVGIIPLHDAVIGPLPFSGYIVHSFNWVTHKINSSYSVLEEIQKMMEKTEKFLTDPESDLYLDPDTLENPSSVRSIPYQERSTMLGEFQVYLADARKLLEEARKDPTTPKDKLDQLSDNVRRLRRKASFMGIFDEVKEKLDTLTDNVKSAREDMYPKGSVLGTMSFFGDAKVRIGEEEDSYDFQFGDKFNYRYSSTSNHKAAVKPLPKFNETVIGVVTGAQEEDKPRALRVNRVIGSARGMAPSLPYSRFVEANELADAPTAEDVYMVTAPGSTLNMTTEVIQNNLHYIVADSHAAVEAGALLIFGRVVDGDLVSPGEKAVLNSLAELSPLSSDIITLDGVDFLVVAREEREIPPSSTPETAEKTRELVGGLKDVYNAAHAENPLKPADTGLATTMGLITSITNKHCG